ncbi:hypothetical protein IC614_05245 [Allosphingosinicella flava]|uniref:Uncharacterized protein n=1 Tax=Allosphingosinicella flava TaxID=2771430 RepID=A0A7T2GLC7_9SPHN|nr:hypothetical protein [Sphingosinicella flava]QPQ55985.1 hypothetical protein IC614_05245 [Sphingosinicella flava]
MAYRVGKILLAAATMTGLTFPQAASAQLFFNNPDFKPGAISASDPLVGLPLPGATAQEYAASLVWNLRAGLNVAALQCQFSPYLRVVDNYNDILAHHSKELMNAYTTVGSYFKRVHGAKPGQKLFDDYSTITYNNFSTLHAQVGFCQTAADIAKDALRRPKGEFHVTAEQRMRELRNSLIPAGGARTWQYNPHTMVRQLVLPTFDPKCYDKKDRLRKKCRGQYVTV